MNRLPIRFALVASLLACGVSAVHAQSSNKPAVLGGGRFVFGQINEYNADQYMLDTQTGRLWRLVDTADGQGSVLEPVPYTLPDGRTQALPLDPEAEAAAAAQARLVPPDQDPVLQPLLPPPRR